MGVLQRDPIPKLCFAMVLTICKNLFADCKNFCHDLTDRSCPRLTPLVSSSLPDTGVDTACFVDGMTLIQMRQDAGASTVGELV